MALFQNKIKDRITTQAIGLTSTGATISQSVNNGGAVVMQGIELQYRMDMLKTFQINPQNWFWSVYGSGYYNFHMVDEGLKTVIPSATIDKPLRMYESQLAINTRFGQHGEAWHDWSFQVTGLLNGRMWYNTEEHLHPPRTGGQHDHLPEIALHGLEPAGRDKGLRRLDLVGQGRQSVQP